jgi:hypothetical protein
MTRQLGDIDCPTESWEYRQLYVALSQVKGPVDMCVLLPFDISFTVRPPLDLDVLQILETMNSFNAPPITPSLPGATSNQIFLPSTDLTHLIQANSHALMTISTLPRIQLGLFPDSTVMPQKLWIPTLLAYLAILTSSRVSLMTHGCSGSIVLEMHCQESFD